MFPERLQVRFRYHDFFTFASTSGIPYLQIFRGNSLFDPDYTTTGHQPFGFDQWKSIYGNYRVFASSIKCTFNAQTSTSGVTETFRAAVVPRLVTTSLASDIPAWTEAPWVQTATGNLFRPTVLNQYMSTAKISSVSPSAVASEDNYQAASSANPTDQWYWHIYVQTGDSSTTSNILVDVELVYYAQLEAPNVGASS